MNDPYTSERMRIAQEKYLRKRKELYAVIVDGECIGRATHLSDAKDIARRWNGKVVDTKKELSIGRFYEEDDIIGEVTNEVTLNYKDKRVISNGYFSVLRNEFINFDNRKKSKKIDYDDGEYF
tara:strand:+ start:250 stop:618 length:369 start_codon:yes stop_codon:yes gene_type:complete